MGGSQNQPCQLSFNRFLRVDFQCRLLKKISGGSGIQGSRVTSDGGLLAVRELDEPIVARVSPPAVILIKALTSPNTQVRTPALQTQATNVRHGASVLSHSPKNVPPASPRHKNRAVPTS